LEVYGHIGDTRENGKEQQHAAGDAACGEQRTGGWLSKAQRMQRLQERKVEDHALAYNGYRQHECGDDLCRPRQVESPGQPGGANLRMRSITAQPISSERVTLRLA
jgi:hypothetical protein